MTRGFFTFHAQRWLIIDKILNVRAHYSDDFAEAWCEARRLVKTDNVRQASSVLVEACCILYREFSAFRALPRAQPAKIVRLVR